MYSISSILRIFANQIKRAISLDIDEVKKFIKQTHDIEGEDVDPGLVDDWVDFALGGAKKPPSKKHPGIEGHLHILSSGRLPTSIEDILHMYKTIGETGVLRGSKQEVRPKGGGKYTLSEKIGDELIEWLDKAKMGTFKSHVEFEKIHPCNDGNGRVGRLILLLGGYLVKELNKLISSKNKYLDKIESF